LHFDRVVFSSLWICFLYFESSSPGWILESGYTSKGGLMEIRLRRAEELLQLMADKFGMLPNELVDELSELLRAARLEQDFVTMETAVMALRAFTADNGPIRYERNLGRFDEMLREVEAALQRLEAEPLDLAELERAVLRAVNGADHLKTREQVAMEVNAARQVGIGPVGKALESLTARGQIHGEPYDRLTLYGRIQEQPVRA
jgi:hypothetical protein